MTDRYQALVSSGLGKKVATQLGLPRPARLKRYDPDWPLLPGPVLVSTLGTGTIGSVITDALAVAGADVLTGDDEHSRYGAVVVDATGVTSIAGLAGLRDTFAGVLRRVRSSGRVVIFGTAPSEDGSPELAAARQALDGTVRSLAKELRAGGTANLVYVDSSDPSAVAIESTLRFFLSGRSAYVDGQVVHVNPATTEAPANWKRPLDGKVALVTGAARGIGAAISIDAGARRRDRHLRGSAHRRRSAGPGGQPDQRHHSATRHRRCRTRRPGSWSTCSSATAAWTSSSTTPASPATSRWPT